MKLLPKYSGGLDSRSQEAVLRKNPDIVIATPGRLVDHLHNTPSFNLGTVEILVLDEADKWVGQGVWLGRLVMDGEICRWDKGCG